MNIDELNRLIEHAKEYRRKAQKTLERNNHMNEIEKGEKVQQRIIDAVLTDFINQIAFNSCIDLGLYTSDLAE